MRLKKNFTNCLLVTFSLTLFSAVYTHADDISVQVRSRIGGVDQPDDNQVVPWFRVRNTGSSAFNLSDIALEYFIYEPNLNVENINWRNDWCRVGGAHGVSDAYTVSFSRMPEPYTEGAKKADIRMLVSFSNKYTLNPNEIVEIQMAFYRNDWSYNFSETAHWSWQNVRTFTITDKVVIIGAGNYSCGPDQEVCVISGIQPPTWNPEPEPTAYRYPFECGPGDNMKLDEGNVARFGQLAFQQDFLSGKQNLVSTEGLTIDERYFQPNWERRWTKNVSLNSSELRFNYIPARLEYPEEYERNTFVNCSTVNTHRIESLRAFIDGTLRAREIIVDTESWADFVFEDDYSLKPLSEVESFIKNHRHLPGIPPANEVKEKGVNLGEMQVLLLQKIEELTLHCIRLEKELNELKSGNTLTHE